MVQIINFVKSKKAASEKGICFIEFCPLFYLLRTLQVKGYGFLKTQFAVFQLYRCSQSKPQNIAAKSFYGFYPLMDA